MSIARDCERLGIGGPCSGSRCPDSEWCDSPPKESEDVNKPFEIPKSTVTVANNAALYGDMACWDHVTKLYVDSGTLYFQDANGVVHVIRGGDFHVETEEPLEKE